MPVAARFIQRSKPFLAAACDLVFPPMCMLCGLPFEDVCRVRFCHACRERLFRDKRLRCARCCSVIPEHSSCLRCASTPAWPFAAAVCLGAYERELRDAILRSKNSAEIPLAAALGEELCDLAGETLRAWKIDHVAAMPMHWMRRFVRGVNSPQIIAERIARRLGVAENTLLVRGRNTPPQASLPPSTRPANVRGAFKVRRPKKVDRARILLVDDVMTTGATCREAATTLLKSGAAAVFVAVLGRADS
jgi:ComF family protein